MTKARDLANAGTALTTVSATELGYLDGVTSAVQTQLDAKVSNAGGSTVTVSSGTTVPLTITNEGTGNSFVVQDSANPDSTPFIVDATGLVGIGMTPNTGRTLSVFNDTTPVIQLTNTASGTTAADGSLVYYNGTDLNFRAAESTGQIIMQTGGTTERVRIASDGRITIPAGGVLEAPLVQNQQTASYTLVLADAGKLVEISNASANNLTVPLNSSVTYPIGTQINILQTGAGQTTVVATGGVTINATPGLKLRAQWSSATLIKRAGDTWVLVGDLSA